MRLRVVVIGPIEFEGQGIIALSIYGTSRLLRNCVSSIIPRLRDPAATRC